VRKKNKKQKKLKLGPNGNATTKHVLKKDESNAKEAGRERKGER
jgi:hypothetical protein